MNVSRVGIPARDTPQSCNLKGELMMASATTSLVEVRPLKPFVGSYKCSLSEADVIDDETVEEAGQIIKRKVARKRFAGFIPVERMASPEEAKLYADEDKVPDNIDFYIDHKTPMVREWPAHRTIKVPAEVASSLASRGLAEVVKGKREAA
jgi:hypothetical protein